MDYINSLPQPFIGRFIGGDEWPIYDIDVQTGLLRIDVCGKLQAKDIADVRFFRDDDGVEHDSETFYSDYAEANRLGSGTGRGGKLKRSERSPK